MLGRMPLALRGPEASVAQTSAFEVCGSSCGKTTNPNDRGLPPDSKARI